MTAYVKVTKPSSIDVQLLECLSQDDLNAESRAFYDIRVHPSVGCQIKRTIDVIGALIGLLLSVAIAIPIAIAMAIGDRGPLLYSQMRCGLDGKPFKIWKFRSMVVNADKMQHLIENEATGHIFKNENDPRITRIGSFLRRTSLDEFPQFWNVLMGDMSLVGTRPPTLDEVKGYEQHHWERLKVKPGMTGEWQVKGRSNVKDFEAIVAMDIEYQRRWSISYDFYLIWKTIEVVLNKHGAC